MAAAVLSGKVLAAQVKQTVSQQVQALRAQGVVPCLAVIMVGNNPASAAYVRGKEKDCAECGIESRVLHLPEATTQEELLAQVARFAADDTVHGLLVQLPLPAQIDDRAVIEAIPPAKDVDCFTAVNLGRLLLGEETFVPCTPAGVMVMLQAAGVELAGKQAVVLGRSNIVGKPMALLLTRANATVTVCHSRTRDLTAVCRQADVLIAAVGKAGFVTADMVKPGAVVIDVGINRNAEGKMCGDVDFDAVSPKAACISPVPGGVGLMTRAMLLVNTLAAAKAQTGAQA